MSVPFTPEQEARVREIAAQMVGQALRGADARVREITNSTADQPMQPEAVEMNRCDPCTVGAHRPGAACNHPDCDLRGRPPPKTGATPPSPRARVAPVPDRVRSPVHAKGYTNAAQ